MEVGDTLYGTTFGGGTNGYGTFFSASLSGRERVLYNFKGGTDGDQPDGALFGPFGPKAEFYGTTYQGGKGSGTVFEVSSAGTERVSIDSTLRRRQALLIRVPRSPP